LTSKSPYKEHVDCISMLFKNSLEDIFDVSGTLNGYRGNAEVARRLFGFTQLHGVSRIVAGPQHGDTRETRDDLPQQL
jgi:hypothetical protein